MRRRITGHSLALTSTFDCHVTVQRIAFHLPIFRRKAILRDKLQIKREHARTRPDRWITNLSIISISAQNSPFFIQICKFNKILSEFYCV